MEAIKIDQVTDLKSSVKHLRPRFNGMEEIVLSMPMEGFLAYCNSYLSDGIGSKIRNHLGLWDDQSIMHNYFKKQGIIHPDDMCGVIIRKIHETILNEISEEVSIQG